MLVRCVLLVAVLLLPAAQGSVSVSITFSGLDMATIHSDSPIAGDNATALRQNADREGDRDGIVTATEAQAFNVRLRTVTGDKLTEGLKGGFITLDGRVPTTVRLDRLEVTGLAGAVTSAQAMSEVWDVAASFEPATGNDHTLLLKGGQRADAPPVAMTITAPLGYAIASTTGLPADAHLDAANAGVSFTQVPTASDTTVVFSKATAAASPAPTAIIVAGVMLCAALVRRRA